MRYPKVSSALTAMLCAAALSVFACGREAEEQPTDFEPSSTAESTVEETAPLTDPEIREERSVEAREEVAAAEQDDLEAHDRALDQREAELEARARRLREQERRQREMDVAEREIERRETQAPTPRPAAPRPAAPQPRPEPEPREEVETEDVRPAPEAEPEPDRAPEPEPISEEREEPGPEPVTVETGTVLSVELLETLSSENTEVGETFRARVSGDVRQDGRVVIPAGSEVVGEVTEVVPLRKVGGRAKLGIRFTDLVLPSGTSVPIDASFVEQGKSETGRDAATIGGAAAGGAILGRVLNKGDRSKGAVIGAILGAAVGTAVASRTPGEEVHLFEGSVVDLKLDRPVEIRPRR
jgi:type IV secretory pathway VirB10-like protein